MHESRETCFKTLRPLGLCSIFSHNALGSPDAQDKITKLLTKQSTSSLTQWEQPHYTGVLEGGAYLIHFRPLKIQH